MLFNSFEFLFVFLPVCLLVYYMFKRSDAPGSARLAVVWLIACSLVFYAWWQPWFILILLGSILVNFFIGQRILAAASGQKFDINGNNTSSVSNRSKIWLTTGIVFNLALLGWFKYAVFIAGNLSRLPGVSLDLVDITLPLAISFFTFQQIAWLIDCRKRLVTPGQFIDYVLFVAFFPQLISGPIVHHSEMMPQFRKPLSQGHHYHITTGLTLFTFGLFKKTVIADGIGQYAAPVFDAPATALTFADAWGGALAYSMQLYFDFSGYSDMAIGLAFMFAIRLPLNFYSPYRAINITEFWRRWHMTLSRFLRDYLYIPLGGNRHGSTRRYSNLMITMVLGGLWHGAGWHFMLWGALHGLYLTAHQFWIKWRGPGSQVWWRRGLSMLLTFILVVIAWVPFRSDSVLDALIMYQAMFFSADGAMLGPFATSRGTIILALVIAAAVLAPNTRQILGRHDPAIAPVGLDALQGKQRSLVVQWSPSLMWGLVTLVLLVAAMYRMMTTGYVEFLYRFF